MITDKTICTSDVSQDLDVTCRLDMNSEAQEEVSCKKIPLEKKQLRDVPGGTTLLGDMLNFLQHRVIKSSKQSIGEKTAFGNMTEFNSAIRIDAEAPESVDMPALERQYEILKKFAEGGQGILSTAQDKILKRVVALKSLRTEHLDNPIVRQAFLNEALITAQLEHPAIVTIYSLLKDEKEGVHLTMKLVHGQTLKDILHSDVVQLEHGQLSRWAYDEILRKHIDIFLRVCDAISYAHSRGIIHCDLKPENLMVGEYGEAYVMDWGIAKSLSALKDSPKEGKGPLDGTPRFMPPEAFRSGTRDTRADIYALGLILFEIVTLTHAYEADSIKDVIRLVLDGARKPVKNRFGVPLPASLVAIVDKATAYAPEDRYQSVEEFSTDLRRLLADEPIKALPDTVLMKVRRFVSRHAKAMLSVALIGWAIAFFSTVFSLKQAQEQANTLRDANDYLNYSQCLFNMAGNVVHSSIMVSNRMVDVARRLRRVADFAAMLNDSTLNHEQCEDDLDILDYREYRKPGSIAFGAEASPVFYGANINPNILSYIIPISETSDAYLAQLDQMRPISSDLRDLVLYSDGDLQKGESVEERIHGMLYYGLLIRRAYIGLESTGLQIAYPFNPEYSDDYDNRKRPWYLVTRKNLDETGGADAVWGAPYQDAGNGRILLACTYPILNRQGEFIGVAGADVHFDGLVQYIRMNGNGLDDGVVEKFLVNRDGTNLCRIDMRIGTPTDVDSLLNVKFPLPRGVFNFIRNGEPKKEIQQGQAMVAGRNDSFQYIRGSHGETAGWLETKEHRESYLYFYAILPNSDLVIVEKCDKGLVLKNFGIDSKKLEKFSEYDRAQEESENNE